MLTYYQPFLLPFLHRKRYTLPDGVFQTHFLSFEDAMWSIFSLKNISQKSIVLVPDFYCMDVVENIERHGYTPVFYPLDNNFQIAKLVLERLIDTYKPSVLILFHACGITNTRLADGKYIEKLCNHMLVVEDCVHRLINPSTVSVYHPNHFMIDSVRKVSPLYGSFVYSKMPISIPKIQMRQKEYSYIILTHLLYSLFRIAFVLGVVIRSYGLVSFAHKRLLRFHDDLVGDSTYGYKGSRRNRMLHHYIDFSYIETHKQKQVALYEHLLKPLYIPSSPWYKVHMRSLDKKLLHVYPVGFKSRADFIVADVEKVLRDNRIPVWFKFQDSPWSNDRAVLFLPLGFHVTTGDIQRVCRLLIQSHRLSAPNS